MRVLQHHASSVNQVMLGSGHRRSDLIIHQPALLQLVEVYIFNTINYFVVDFLITESLLLKKSKHDPTNDTNIR